MSHARDSAGLPASRGRLDTALRRLRWPVVIFWVTVVVILNPFASGLSNLTNNGTAANLPASASSTRVAALQQQAQHSSADVDQAIVVFASGNRLTAGDLAAVASTRTAVARLAARAGGLDPPGAPQRSADGQADEFSADISSQPSSEASGDASAVQAIRQAAGQAASRAGGGLQVAVTGPAAVTADSGTADETLLLARALLIVAVILLLVYRSPVLWLLPLLGAAGPA
jgi:RND superfamily putative drug exporter